MEFYEVSLELEPQEGSEYYGLCVGVFVYAYVSASSIRGAISLAESWAQGIGYSIIDVDHALRIDLADYEPHDGDYPTRDQFVLSRQTGETLHGPFLCYESRES